MSTWLLNVHFETTRQNSDFSYTASTSLTSEKTVEIHGVVSYEVVSKCHEHKGRHF